MTEELLAKAGALKDLAEEAQAQLAPLSAQTAGASSWCGGRAVQAAQAFFDALAWAGRGAADGLGDLGRRTAVAGDVYDGAERALPFHR